MDIHHFQLFATLTFDQIWLMRNEIKHHPRTHIDPLELSKTILCLTKEYMQAWSYTSVPMSHPCSVDISVPFAGLRFQFDARFEKIFLLQPQYAWIPQTLFLLQGRSSTMMLQTCSELKPWQHKWPQLCILHVQP